MLADELALPYGFKAHGYAYHSESGFSSRPIHQGKPHTAVTVLGHSTFKFERLDDQSMEVSRVTGPQRAVV